MKEEQDQWFTNKQLFIMWQESTKEIMGHLNELSLELAETRRVVAAYNNLRGQLDKVCNQVIEIEKKGIGKREVADGIRLWGGWILAVLGLGWAIISRFVK